ncbi:hypothetical protein [Mycolicibacterium elephantis]|uniref:hypothetical protein n=1 Tax=Mycolicibacterium elephantis TaxID=81858 RepID=UPI000ABA5796
MTVTSEIRDDSRETASDGPQRPVFDDRPVEFWPTAAIRAALETDDLAVWQRIVAAIKRDPFGRTARQVEEVLETARPYGLSKALTEVLSRTISDAVGLTSPRRYVLKSALGTPIRDANSCWPRPDFSSSARMWRATSARSLASMCSRVRLSTSVSALESP